MPLFPSKRLVITLSYRSCKVLLNLRSQRVSILNGEVPVLEDALPNASVTGFTRPSAALAFAKNTKIALAFLDIEMGQINGLDLCRDLLKIHPNTNVIFLTAYMEYSFQAWDTGACGFLLKPITTKTVRHQLGLLRYPVRGLI